MTQTYDPDYSPVTIEREWQGTRLFYSLPGFLGDKPRTSLVATGVLVEMLADRIEPWVRNALTNISPEEPIPITEGNYGLTISRYIPEILRKLAESFRDDTTTDALIRSAERSWQEFVALPGSHYDWLMLQLPLTMLYRTRRLARRDERGYLVPTLSAALKDLWMVWMQRLLLWWTATYTRGVVQPGNPHPMMGTENRLWIVPIHEPDPETEIGQDRLDQVMGEAYDLNDEWWERFQQTLPWIDAPSSQLM